MRPSSTDTRNASTLEAHLPPAAPGLKQELIGVTDPNRTVLDPSTTALQILGQSECRVWGKRVTDALTDHFRAAGLECLELDEDAIEDHANCVIVRGDFFLDRSAVALLLALKSSAIVIEMGDEDARPIAVHCTGSEAKAWRDLLLRERSNMTCMRNIEHIIDAATPPLVFDHELRKQCRPLIQRATPKSCREIERTTFELAYKGVTDLVTKYIFPWPAFHATRIAVRFGWTPNAITTASLVLTIAVTGLFAEGLLAAGLLTAFAMSFLDTVDGKLARVTQNSSQFGKRFDHLIDQIHPPFWWLAWGWGTAGSQAPAGLNEAAAIATLGYVALRFQESKFKRRFGARIHVWRRFDSRFRLITSRRNPNLLLLSGSLLIGRPELGLFWVAGWTLVSLAIHSVRWLQAETELRRNGPLNSWLEVEGSPEPIRRSATASSA
jgi:phosphatidylglycerophosphate synthase